jgi:hypothetical protein
MAANPAKMQVKYIAKAMNIHGDTYDYSCVDYKGLNIPINIICRKHGMFTLNVISHIRDKSGCPTCKKESEYRDTVNSIISKSKIKFGKKYDYSKLNFINTRTPITIICPIHGEQSMYVYSHLRGTGCAECGKEISGPKKSVTDEFIAKAIGVHGVRYVYTDVDYIDSGTKVNVICKEHGVFHVTPKNHVAGSNCPSCDTKNRLTQEEVISRFINTHGDTYDYINVNFVNVDTKVQIRCLLHGDFEQMPIAHMVGQGCPECGKIKTADSKRKDLEYFLATAKEVHGDRYDYSKVVLGKILKDKVIIGCDIHGDFEQAATSHLNGLGCNKCGYIVSFEKLTKTTEQFILDAKNIHGNKFGYERSVYVNNHTPITITCKTHGNVLVRPSSHLQGSGCPKCLITKGESKIEDWLISNNIKYVREYRIAGTRYRYDFYLPDLNILIEYDGELHYIPVTFFGGHKTLNRIKINDKEKNTLAELHNIHLIRIPYIRYGVLENFLEYKISKLYKYRVDGKFYRGFLELCNSLNLPDTTRNEDVKQHLTYNKVV